MSQKRRSLVVPILALIFTAVVALNNGGEIRHFQLDGAHLIETSYTNYALTNSPALNQALWKSVSVNGNNVVIITPNCQVLTKDSSNLSEVEKNLIATAKNELGSVGQANGNQFSSRNSAFSSFSMNDGQVRQQISNNNNNINNGRQRVNINLPSSSSSSSSFQNGDLSISKQDDNNFSLTKSSLPNNLARVFVNNDVVTFVYKDGQVQMKPIACLLPQEQQLLQQLRSETIQAERQFKQNMANMQQQMQQSMQNMQHQMQNMFGGNNFFNGAANAAANTFAQPAYQSQGQYNQQQPLVNPYRPAASNLFNQIQTRPFVQPNIFGGSTAGYQYAAPNYMQQQQQGFGGMQMGSQQGNNMFGTNWPFGPNNNPFQGNFFSQ